MGPFTVSNVVPICGLFQPYFATFLDAAQLSYQIVGTAVRLLECPNQRKVSSEPVSFGLNHLEIRVLHWVI